MCFKFGMFIFFCILNEVSGMKSKNSINMLKREWLQVPKESETIMKTPLLKRLWSPQKVKSKLQRQSSLPNNKSYEQFGDEVKLSTPVSSGKFHEFIRTKVWEELNQTSIEDCEIETGTPKKMSEEKIDLDQGSYRDADVPTMNIIQKMNKTLSSFKYNHNNTPLTAIITQNNETLIMCKDHGEYRTLFYSENSFLNQEKSEIKLWKNRSFVCKWITLEVNFPEDFETYLTCRVKKKHIFTKFLLYITWLNGCVYSPLYYYPLEWAEKYFTNSDRKRTVLTVLLNILVLFIPTGQHWVMQAFFPKIFSKMLPSLLLSGALSTLSYIDWVFLRHPYRSLGAIWHVPAVKYPAKFYGFIFIWMLFSVYFSYAMQEYLCFLGFHCFYSFEEYPR